MHAKEALLAVSTEPTVNIGDYIQILAAGQFIEKADCFVERERIDEYEGENIRMILNGWYMHHGRHWPPSPRIHPLFLSFHLNISARHELLSPQGKAYFKRHEPIGCRDRGTMLMLREAGIEAYFSGCLTLTLGMTGFHNKQKEDRIYIVDPCLTGGRPAWDTDRIRDFLTLLRHPRKMHRLTHKRGIAKASLHELLRTACFYNEYRRCFEESVLLEAEYLHHAGKEYKENYPTQEARLEKAEELVRQYARAKLVITSRIHCALPCLGVGTPVFFVENADDGENGTCRMDGIRELFHTLTWQKGKIRGGNFRLTRRIGNGFIPANKEDWRPLAEKMTYTCKLFYGVDKP